MKKKLLSIILTSCILASMYIPAHAENRVLTIVSGKVGGNMVSLYDSLGYKIESDGTVAAYGITDTNSDAGQPNVGVNSQKEINAGNITDGRMQAKNGHYANQSAWNGCNITGVFDLGKEKQIHRVDLWWYQARGSVENSSLRLRVSKDNINWTEVITSLERNTVLDVTANLNYSMASHTFDTISARYFEVTLISSGQIFFDEVIAFGGSHSLTSPSKNITVVSGNPVNATAVDHYKDYGYNITFDTNAEAFTYENIYVGGDKNYIEDTSTNEINDGEMHIKGRALWGNFSADCEVNIDLKKEKTFDRVDVWSLNGRAKALAAGVWVSDDGETWRSVAYTGVPASSEDENPVMELISVQFAPQTARYIKVHMYKKYSQIIISEIYVINSAPSVLGMEITGTNGGEVHSINVDYDAGGLIAKGEIAIGGVLLAAHYRFTEDGIASLQNIYTSEVPYGENSFDLGKAEDYAFGDVIKFFALDGTTTLRAIEETIEVPVGNAEDSALISSGETEDSEVEILGTATTHSLVKNGIYASDDIDCTALFDGDRKTEVSAGSSKYINADMTFASVMDADFVNVYGKNISEIGVYASLDGYNFDAVLIEEITPQEVTDKYHIELPGVVYAKSLRVMVTGDDGKNLSLTEIEAFGKYPKYQKERKTSYRYDTEVPFVTSEEVRSWDEDNTLLSDSDYSDEIVSYDGYVSVIYDLGGIYQVEDVTVYGYHGGMEFLTSPDGKSFYTAGFFANDSDETMVYGRSEHNAKFVKLVFHPGDDDMIYLSEIRLFARKLYDWADENEIPVRVTVKPNNIAFIDWTDYRASESGNCAYNVYIEDEEFTDASSLTPKKVFVDHSTLQVSNVRGKYCTYAGLAPESEYYVAVLPSGAVDKTVLPVKIKTNPALGGGSISGIFCTNEYNGGAYIQDYDEIQALLESGTQLWGPDNITEAELEAIPSDNNSTEKVRKLMADMEVISKNRHFGNPNSNMPPYLPRGISWFCTLPTTQSEVDRYNGWGVYTFSHTNEPEITDKYIDDPDKFGEEFSQIIADKYATLKSMSPNSLLYSPTTCGTDWLGHFKKLYEYKNDLSDHYDVCDVHTYSKNCDPEEETIKGAESENVPEKLFKKVEIVSDIIETYGDPKEIVATEMGWPTSNTPSVLGKSDEHTQANYIARMYLCGIMAGMKEIYLYAVQDEGYLSNEEVTAGKSYIARLAKEKDESGNPVYYIARSAPSQEHAFGIIDWYGNPQPGYYAYYTLGKVLKDCEYVRRIDGFGDLNYGGEFYDKVKNKYVTVLWNISGNGDTVGVSSDEEKLLSVSIYGNSSYITPGDISIGSAPIYIYSEKPLTISVK